MIGIILLSVRTSVRLCVTLCIVAFRVGVHGQKLHQRVPSMHVPICPFRHFCCRMYRLATKCTTKNEVRNAISVYGLRLLAGIMSRRRTARLSTMTRAVNRAAEVCRLRTQISSNCWIRGLTANGFFTQRSRCCDHNE